MIKINLLGAETETSDKSVLLIVEYFASLVAVLVICFVLYRFKSSEITSLQDQSESLKTQLARLKEQTKEVRDLEKKKEELQKITSALGQLKLIQVGPVQALSDIDMALPAKMWIRSIVEKEGELTISGIALDDFSVSTFLKNLETSPYFSKRIDLQESTTISLVQISAFNAFESAFTTYIVPAEEKSLVKSVIRKEAEKAGLGIKEDQAPRFLSEWKNPGKNAGGNPDTMGGQGLAGSSAGGDKVLGFGIRRVTKEPTVYVWNAPEGTEGKLFVVKVGIDYLQGRPKVSPQDASVENTAGSINPKDLPGLGKASR